MIENPVTILSSYWRRPDFFFDPCDFGAWLDPAGDHYEKKTSVWTGNGFRRPQKRRVEALYTERKIHNLPRTPDRGDIRSIRREVSPEPSLPLTARFQNPFHKGSV